MGDELHESGGLWV